MQQGKEIFCLKPTPLPSCAHGCAVRVLPGVGFRKQQFLSDATTVLDWKRGFEILSWLGLALGWSTVSKRSAGLPRTEHRSRYVFK